MLIKKIKLSNIRSYLDKEIIFPEGRTLLSGDIGSGKSTILLAIDFALFGIQKGNLSGGSLLRNGKKEGYVELSLEFDNDSYVIRRTLKRGVNVAQESGYIIENNKKRDLSPIELKQAVLDILNYPKELLSKSKSLIYRYTVYTPQEEMKQILIEEKDLRLDVLRKLFGIDKYKRVKENVKIISSRLREKMKEYSGFILDLNVKLNNKELIEKRITDLNNYLIKLNQDLTIANESVEFGKKRLKEFEDNIKGLNNLKKEYEVNETNLRNKLSLINDLKSKILNMEESVKLLKKEIKDIEQVSDEELESKENEINFMADTINNIKYKIKEAEIKINNSKDIKNNIVKLDICPVCKQNVSKDHVNHINDNENKIINDNEKAIKLSKEQLIEADNKLVELKKDYQELKNDKYELELNKFRIKNIEEKEKELIHSNKEIIKLKEELGNLTSTKGKLADDIESYKNLDKDYNKERELIDSLLNKQKAIEINIASSRREVLDKEKELTSLLKEIESRNLARENLEKLNTLKFWLENDFVNLLDNMEKSIMLRIYNDFNPLFQKWSDMLIDNENIKIRLNEEFSPLIEQNGYDIEYEFLSGGEKTATALAYRLALNQIINNLISDIKTRDILILDEPTDGFSDEQLDRVKLVLDELNVKQLIVVSHETKVESFVDNIIRLEKRNHVTEII